jgi:hypothetical protein
VVGALGVVGKQVHDARLLAVCQVHGVTHLLTFNVSHFARLAGFGPVLWWSIPQPCEPSALPRAAAEGRRRYADAARSRRKR